MKIEDFAVFCVAITGGVAVAGVVHDCQTRRVVEAEKAALVLLKYAELDYNLGLAQGIYGKHDFLCFSVNDRNLAVVPIDRDRRSECSAEATLIEIRYDTDGEASLRIAR